MSSGQDWETTCGSPAWGPDWERAPARGRGARRVGLCGGNGIAWLVTRGFVLLFAEPIRAVDVWFDGRGRGVRRGSGKAAVWNQAFDGYDHRKGFELDRR